MEIELELKPDSPYSKGYVVDYGDGTYTLERPNDIYSPKPGDIIHAVIMGDTLSNIAFTYYGNSKLWHKIAHANLLDDVISDLLPGSNLIIPDPQLIED